MARRKKTKLSKEERLARMRERLAETDTQGGINWWSPKEGTNRIRVLPEIGDMGFFFVQVGVHYINTPTSKNRIYCPSFSTKGAEDCPVCEHVSDLYKAGNPSLKERANEVRVRKQYWMNIVDRKDEAGVKVFTSGPLIFGSIKSYINDPDYGDITDEYEGADVIIEREGTGYDTDYQTKVARNDSPLHDDDEQIDEWFEDATDLTVVLLSDDPGEDEELKEGKSVWVSPYSRIQDEYDLEAIIYLTDEDEDDYDDDDEDEEEEVEETHPVKRVVSTRRTKRRRRR